MELLNSMMVSAAGMRVQGQRMRIVAENIANANSQPTEPGGDPYRRKLVIFKNLLDRELGARLVEVDKVTVDNSEFQKRYDPGNPAADADGYIKLPNVNALVEMMDMREAQRSYEANLTVIESAKQMMARTVELLR